jgi:hypothetical protein
MLAMSMGNAFFKKYTRLRENSWTDGVAVCLLSAAGHTRRYGMLSMRNTSVNHKYVRFEVFTAVTEECRLLGCGTV